MSHLLLTVALAALYALPHHPLNESIGGPRENFKPPNLDQVRESILQSRAFHQMVASSVRLAQDPRLAEDVQLQLPLWSANAGHLGPLVQRHQLRRGGSRLPRATRSPAGPIRWTR